MSPTAPTDDELLTAARAAQANAHAPYSRFPVGAALLTESGEVYSGCNVENASLGLTLCAERAAVAAAVAAGHRRFEVLAVVTDQARPVQPCGACRQFLAEFGTDLRVLAAGTDGDVAETRLAELLPGTFRLDTER